MSDTTAKPAHVVFPVGYHDLHPDVSVNFQMNRFYNWVGDDSMLSEMRAAAAGVNDYPTFTKIFLDLGEKALAQGQTLKGAYYLRLAEFFLFTNDPRKLIVRRRFVDVVLQYFAVPPSAHSRIPYQSKWLSAYRLSPEKPRGTFVVFGGFDSYIEEWLPAALWWRDAGYDTIMFEGPGQGAVLEEALLPMTVHWEQPVKAVLDFYKLDDVTLMGFSLGGGLVVHAAAFESRVKRVIAYDILSDFLDTLLQSAPPSVRQQILGWLDSKNESAVNDFYRAAMSASLLVDWGMQQGMHVSGTKSPYELLQFYRSYTTADISPLVKQDVLLMCGAEDHYVPVHQLPEQIATLTNVRSLTARLFTRAEQAQNHVQIGNMGLAFRVMMEWLDSLDRRN